MIRIIGATVFVFSIMGFIFLNPTCTESRDPLGLKLSMLLKMKEGKGGETTVEVPVESLVRIENAKRAHYEGVRRTEKFLFYSMLLNMLLGALCMCAGERLRKLSFPMRQSQEEETSSSK